MDTRLVAFLERVETVLNRLEPLLPVERPALDWSRHLAARWQREGQGGYLLPRGSSRHGCARHRSHVQNFRDGTVHDGTRAGNKSLTVLS